MKILAIESSCDETGVAIYCDQQGLLADQLFSQVDLHADYGGVVPELASRDHIRKTIPLVDACLKSAKLESKEIDGVAYTAGPGLIGALLVGATIGRSLAYAWQVPAVAVHHMEGHLLAPMLEDNPPQFPFIGLLVSGGHTLLIKVDGIGQYQILGESIDDAVGEAFDKTAKGLGLDYPGGAKLAQMAKQGRAGHFRFPRPMTDRPGLDFSFSGLKTFANNTMRQEMVNQNITELSKLNEQSKADIAYAFQDAVVDTLVIKCKRALEQTGLNRLVVSGGVSANLELRAGLEQMVKKIGGALFYPSIKYCTDNGAMIAYAGMQRLKYNLLHPSEQINSDHLKIQVKPRWPLTDLEPI